MEYVKKSVDIADRITKKNIEEPVYNGYLWSFDSESWCNRIIICCLIFIIVIFIWSDIYGIRTCNSCDNAVGGLFDDCVVINNRTKLKKQCIENEFGI